MPGQDELAEDMEFFGLYAEAEEYARRPAPVVELWPEHVTCYRVFVALETQWRMVVGFAGLYYQGIDYTNAKSTMELMAVPANEWPQVFDGLRVMERAAKTVLNKKE
ncbi:DUF1799 domain-containing protein [Pseudoduganella sp. RAF53_2]|uniref:DUF1799 domain-containing protein n=1 Tax=unclassified Pseudoduganella TaxID=2637179 RepID=UPI003F9A3D80